MFNPNYLITIFSMVSGNGQQELQAGYPGGQEGQAEQFDSLKKRFIIWQKNMPRHMNLSTIFSIVWGKGQQELQAGYPGGGQDGHSEQFASLMQRVSKRSVKKKWFFIRT